MATDQQVGPYGPYQYALVHHSLVSEEKQIEYWQALIDANLLKYRMADVKNPTLDDVQKMVENPNNSTFYIFDLRHETPPNCPIVMEGMLNNPQPPCTQTHFSAHPSLHRHDLIQAGRQAIQQVFNLRFNNPPILIQSVIGITPVTNRLALRFVRNMGYTEKCVLTKAFSLAYSDDAVADAILSQLTVDELGG